MPKTSQREKIAYAKTLRQGGTTRMADIQKGVKAKFGTGLNFVDMARVVPKKAGAKAPAPKRGPGRPPKAKASARGGRPKGWSPDQWLLVVGDDGETFGSKRKLEARVAKAIGEGVPPSAMALYAKTGMKLLVKTAITV
ncbi:MAG: hypothetical protein JXA90_15175, partial [Planctomycetes bacterium]|nr:hypothetical protein [Planctomycetota bacterium]